MDLLSIFIISIPIHVHGYVLLLKSMAKFTTVLIDKMWELFITAVGKATVSKPASLVLIHQELIRKVHILTIFVVRLQIQLSQQQLFLTNI